MLVLPKKHTDTPIEQTKTNPQGTTEFKLSRRMEILPFSRRLDLSQ